MDCPRVFEFRTLLISDPGDGLMRSAAPPEGVELEVVIFVVVGVVVVVAVVVDEGSGEVGCPVPTAGGGLGSTPRSALDEDEFSPGVLLFT